MPTTKINLYDSKFKQLLKSSDKFEKSPEGLHYKHMLCLREVGEKIRTSTIMTAYKGLQDKITNSISDIQTYNRKRLCVLPIGHIGRCCSNPLTEIFLKNRTTDKIVKKVNLSILNTPGADDYVIKNRASRLFPIVLSASHEKLIRNKNVKLKAGISLREFSTPFCLASAYIDWMIYMLNVRGISIHLKKTSKYMQMYKNTDLLEFHKQFLQNYFNKKNRAAFNNRGNTCCSVTRKEINVKDIGDPERDNRLLICKDDVQMGHLIARNENHITIKGLNLSIMTREGNRIIGEYVLFDNDWIDILKKIVSYYT